MKKILYVGVLLMVYVLLLNLSDKGDQPAVEVDTSTQTSFFGMGKVFRIKHNASPNDNWEYQTEIPEGLISIGTYSLVQAKGVWIPKLEPGEQAVKLTGEGVNLYLDNGDYQRDELCWLAIYDYGNPSPVTKLGDNDDIQLHMLAPPNPGQQLKLIVYRLTAEELQR
jgi:hypothetical protein